MRILGQKWSKWSFLRISKSHLGKIGRQPKYCVISKISHPLGNWTLKAQIWRQILSRELIYGCFWECAVGFGRK